MEMKEWGLQGHHNHVMGENENNLFLYLMFKGIIQCAL